MFKNQISSTGIRYLRTTLRWDMKPSPVLVFHGKPPKALKKYICPGRNIFEAQEPPATKAPVASEGALVVPPAAAHGAWGPSLTTPRRRRAQRPPPAWDPTNAKPCSWDEAALLDLGSANLISLEWISWLTTQLLQFQTSKWSSLSSFPQYACLLSKPGGGKRIQKGHNWNVLILFRVISSYAHVFASAGCFLHFPPLQRSVPPSGTDMALPARKMRSASLCASEGRLGLGDGHPACNVDSPIYSLHHAHTPLPLSVTICAVYLICLSIYLSHLISSHLISCHPILSIYISI